MTTSRKPRRIAERIGALRDRHAALDASISEELGRPLPDDIRVQALKKMRLKTKDEIHASLGLLRTIGRPGLRAAAEG